MTEINWKDPSMFSREKLHSVSNLCFIKNISKSKAIEHMFCDLLVPRNQSDLSLVGTAMPIYPHQYLRAVCICVCCIILHRVCDQGDRKLAQACTLTLEADPGTRRIPSVSKPVSSSLSSNWKNPTKPRKILRNTQKILLTFFSLDILETNL